MGIKKIGDRVRIFVGIKSLRTRVGTNQKKRNRESIANLDKYASLDTPTASSLSGFRARERSAGASKRFSSQLTATSLNGYAYPSPKDAGRIGPNGYFSQPQSAKTASGRRPETPSGPGAGIPTTKLPPGTIKIIYNVQTKMLDIKNCKTADDIMISILRKTINRAEQHVRNYCI